MARKTFEIAGVTCNRKQAIELARKALRRRKGAILSGRDREVAAAFYELRRGEPLPDDVPISVDEGAHAKNKCFFVLDAKSKKWVDFSFMKALTEEPKNDKADVLKAFRCEVKGQIDGYRRSALEQSPMLQTMFALDFTSVHVDHIVPFHVLLSDFLRDRDLSVDDVEIEEVTLGVRQLCDRSLAQEWVAYHRRHAKLRLLPATENMSKGATLDLPLYRYRRDRQETYD